jgi:hypothetical protein
MVKAYPNGETVFYRASQERSDVVAPWVQQGGASQMLWGCVSYYAYGPLVAVDGYINGPKYLETLKNVVKPELDASRRLGRVLVFQQDNAKPHKTTEVLAYLNEWGYEVIDWPPQSPDLSPIEQIWNVLKVKMKPMGGFGPDGFRTPLPFPNTPISIAGDTPTLGNQPIRDPVVPLRMFLESVEDTSRKMCNGTPIFKCRTGSIAATSKDCGTCRIDIKELKNTICKNWNNFKNDPSKQMLNRVNLMSRYHNLLEKFDGYWRVDILYAIERINVWKPKVDKMKALWYKDPVMDETILEIPEGEVFLEEEDEAEIIIPTETVIPDYYDMPKDICFICKRDIGRCDGRYCECGLKLEKNGPNLCSCGMSTVDVGRVCKSCYDRLRVCTLYFEGTTS